MEQQVFRNKPVVTVLFMGQLSFYTYKHFNTFLKDNSHMTQLNNIQGLYCIIRLGLLIMSPLFGVNIYSVCSRVSSSSLTMLHAHDCTIHGYTTHVHVPFWSVPRVRIADLQTFLSAPAEQICTHMLTCILVYKCTIGWILEDLLCSFLATAFGINQ